MSDWWRRLREGTAARWARWRRKRARLAARRRKASRRRGGRPDDGDDITRYGDPVRLTDLARWNGFLLTGTPAVATP